MRGESARPGKRPLRALSATEKMEAILRVHEGESKASVARDIGVPESTLRGWCKSEHKIRGMARNSSTPDSEAHSPSSSSSVNQAMSGQAGTSNHSSEDEAMGPSAKKMKMDPYAACDQNDRSETPKMDAKPTSQQVTEYMANIINSIVANGVRGADGNSLLMQHLGMLTTAQNAALAKNLMTIQNSGLATAHLAAASSAAQTVGLVENGLQYTKSSSSSSSGGSGGAGPSGSSKRSSSAHISAIAPTQMDAVSKSGSRKNLMPAAEAPSTPVPATPRKSNDYSIAQLTLQQQQQQQQQQMHAKMSKKEAAAAAAAAAAIVNNGASCSSASAAVSPSLRRHDEALWMWLMQQQHMMGISPATSASTTAAVCAAATTAANVATGNVNNNKNQRDDSWFWHWYKHCTLLLPHAHAAARRSPAAVRALLDSILMNNNELQRRCLNLSMNNGQAEAEEVPQMPLEEAVEHGQKFFEWLDRCSEPTITRLHVLQLKFMLDSLRNRNRVPTKAKQSRK